MNYLLGGPSFRPHPRCLHREFTSSSPTTPVRERRLTVIAVAASPSVHRSATRLARSSRSAPHGSMISLQKTALKAPLSGSISQPASDDWPGRSLLGFRAEASLWRCVQTCAEDAQVLLRQGYRPFWIASSCPCWEFKTNMTTERRGRRFKSH